MRQPRRAAPDRREFNLQCVQILQCLSTFYVPDADVLSTIAFDMVADYTDISRGRVAKLMCYLANRGYVSLAASGDAGRLDPVTWEERSFRCSTKRYFAYFVENAPTCLRDEDSLRAVRNGCCLVPIPDRITGCSVTLATSFNGVYDTQTSRDSCSPVQAPEPREFIFEPRLCLCLGELPSANLWYMQSAFCPEALFRRQLLVMYNGGRDGKTGMQLADQGGCLLLCMHDQVLREEGAADLIAHPCDAEEGTRSFRTLSGCTVVLDERYGIAHYGSDTGGCSRLYRERGVLACGTEIVELAFASSGTSRPRHDPKCVVAECGQRCGTSLGGCRPNVTYSLESAGAGDQYKTMADSGIHARSSPGLALSGWPGRR
jgi:hypothetical protein